MAIRDVKNGIMLKHNDVKFNMEKCRNMKKLLFWPSLSHHCFSTSSSTFSIGILKFQHSGKPWRGGSLFSQFLLCSIKRKVHDIEGFEYCEVENIVKVSDVDQIIGYGHWGSVQMVIMVVFFFSAIRIPKGSFFNFTGHSGYQLNEEILIGM